MADRLWHHGEQYAGATLDPFKRRQSRDIGFEEGDFRAQFRLLGFQAADFEARRRGSGADARRRDVKVNRDKSE